MTHWLSSLHTILKKTPKISKLRESAEDMGSVEVPEAVHVVVVPCHAQGHLNPLQQFAKHLAHRGLKVTLPVISAPANHSLVTIDNVPLLPYDGDEPESQYALWERRKASQRSYLIDLLTRCEASSSPVACVVYDSIMPWVLDIVKQFGVLGAAFFTQSCAVNSVYCNVYKGLLSVPLEQSSVSIDGFSVLRLSEIPSFIVDRVKHPSILDLLVANQFSRLNDADWIFANTFDSLEPEETKWMEGQYPFKNIGPMVPSIYLDGQLQNDKDYGVSLFESNTQSSIKWLDSKPYNNSVIYVSFGSNAELEKEQMEELAYGLKLSNKFFLWVVRESEIHKLPPNFIEDTAEKGLVVKWCPQLKVLAHKSVGCFVTHCGWNSTLEALSLGVPLVAMAQWSDQPTNAKYIEDVWKIGKRVRINENDRVCKRERIVECIDDIMEGENSKEIRENTNTWRERAKEAIGEGGSSDININNFIEQLVKRTT